MGFGILFIGYMLTFGSLFFTMYLYADIIGCAVMIAALLMLCRYNRAFRFPLMATGVLGFVYAAAAAMRLMGYGTPSAEEEFLIGEKVYAVIQTYVLGTVSLLFYVGKPAGQHLLHGAVVIRMPAEFPDTEFAVALLGRL